MASPPSEAIHRSRLAVVGRREPKLHPMLRVEGGMRHFLSAALLALGLAAGATPVSARCRHIEVPEETRSSAYVFEGTLESVSGRDLTFLVTAVWSGTPPSRVTVGTSGRRPLAAASDVGTTYLVFAMGTPPDLSIARCGSSSPLVSAGYALAALEGLGLTRVPR